MSSAAKKQAKAKALRTRNLQAIVLGCMAAVALFVAVTVFPAADDPWIAAVGFFFVGGMLIGRWLGERD
jgi:hypothetical protein